MILISVDLPLPLGPRMATCSPELMLRVKTVERETSVAFDEIIFEFK